MRRREKDTGRKPRRDLVPKVGSTEWFNAVAEGYRRRMLEELHPLQEVAPTPVEEQYTPPAHIQRLAQPRPRPLSWHTIAGDWVMVWESHWQEPKSVVCYPAAGSPTNILRQGTRPYSSWAAKAVQSRGVPSYWNIDRNQALFMLGPSCDKQYMIAFIY